MSWLDRLVLDSSQIMIKLLRWIHSIDFPSIEMVKNTLHFAVASTNNSVPNDPGCPRHDKNF